MAGNGNDTNALMILRGAADVSAGGSDNTPTLVGGVSVSTSVHPPGFGESYDFNGSTGHITAVDSPDWLETAGQPFTYDLWIYPTDTTGNTVSTIFCRNTTGVTTTDYTNCTWFDGGHASAGKIRLTWRLGDVNETSQTSTNALTFNAWNHVAFVYNGSDTLYYFIGGVLSDAISITLSTLPLTTGMFIGKNSWSDTNYAKGYETEPRLSNIARWITGFTPPTGPYTTYSAILDSATITIAGQDITLDYSGGSLPMDSAAITIAGQDLNFTRSLILSLDSAEITIAEQDTDLNYGRLVNLDSATITIAGQDITMTPHLFSIKPFMTVLGAVPSLLATGVVPRVAAEGLTPSITATSEV